MERRVAQIAVAIERRRGRPRNDEPSERMDVRMPRPLFDALCRDAIRRRIPASTLVRRIVSGYFLSGEKSE